MNVTAARVARERIVSWIERTPLIRSRVLSEALGADVRLKLESQQPTGAFKVRCAFNGILCHLDEARAKGVLTTSSGNYAQAVAYAASRLGVKAAIVMTDDTAPVKIEKTRAWGAEVVFCGTTFESRFERLEQLRAERGGVVLHGFDSEETIAGNGTLALELLEDLPGEFTVVTPASGGGLIAGIASVLKEARPDCAVYGAQPEAGGALARSFAKGERVNVGKFMTVADALVASMPGERAFEVVKRTVDGFALVSEGALLEAARWLLLEQKLLAEPGGAAGVAALRTGKLKPRHRTVVCVISGGNADPRALFT